MEGEEKDPKVSPIKVLSLSQPPLSAKKRKVQKSYRKKVESEWSQDQILKLINEIETRRGLWDAGCAEYKMPKEALWQEVADSIDMSLNDCKGKWSNLRISFKSNLEKYRKRKSSQGTITWKYFKPMIFLEANKVQQSTRSNSSMELNSAINDETCLQDVSERYTQDFVSPSPLTSRQGRKRMNTPSPTPSSTPSSTLSPTPSPPPSDSSRLKQIAEEALQSIRSQTKNASTALCDYMAVELQNLTPQQATFARSKLRRAFSDIMDEAALLFFRNNHGSC